MLNSYFSYDIITKFSEPSDMTMPWNKVLSLYSRNKIQREFLIYFRLSPLCTLGLHKLMRVLCVCVWMCVFSHWAKFWRETSQTHLSEYIWFLTQERINV